MTQKAMNRLIMLVIGLVLFFVVVWPFLGGYFGIWSLDPRNIQTALRNAGQTLAEAAPTDANARVLIADPTVTPVVASSSVITSLPSISAAALGILANADQALKIPNGQSGYGDARFTVDFEGQDTAAAAVIMVDRVFTGRIVCDDICSRFAILHPDNSVTVISPTVSYAANFNYSTLDAAVKAQAADYGVNVADSEILAQHIFADPIPVKAGDQILIFGKDDEHLGVNRGVFMSWK